VIEIDSLDQLVLTVTALEISCTSYQRVQGVQVVTFGAGRRALAFARQKINLHLAARCMPVTAGPVHRAGAQGPCCRSTSAILTGT